MSVFSESKSVRKRASEFRDDLKCSICKMQKQKEKFSKM